jgi:osmotically-inducible protein OsmY
MVSRSLKAGLLGIALACLAASAWADSKDVWLTTKAKIALLTADDVKATAVNVDTVDGVITIHGKVPTEASKEKAAAAVRKLDGVKDVKNLLQVVPDSVKETVKVADDAVKDKVEAALKSDVSLDGLKVASVNNGVVLLSGKTDAVDKELKAIEVAWDVDGVRQVRSEIKSSEK